jgi:hypothetical protein
VAKREDSPASKSARRVRKERVEPSPRSSPPAKTPRSDVIPNPYHN